MRKMNTHDIPQYSPTSLSTELESKPRSPLRLLGARPPTPPISTSSNMVLFSKYDTISPSATPHHQHCLSTGMQAGGNMKGTSQEQQDEDELTTNKMSHIIEKKRKRRESHNIVERRRRDNLNARIDELSTLLPPSPPSQYQHKLYRGAILKNSVDYIRMLQDRVMEQQQRIHELENLLRKRHTMAEEQHIQLPSDRQQHQQQ